MIKSFFKNNKTIGMGFTQTLTLTSLLCVFKKKYLTGLFSRKSLFFRNIRARQQNTTPKLVCGFIHALNLLLKFIETSNRSIYNVMSRCVLFVDKKRVKLVHGFTVVEIIIVISIMAFLTAVIYSSFDASKAQSRDQKRISDISMLQLALEQSFNKNGIYPSQLDSLVPTYIPEIPTDPDNDYNNQYFPLTKASASSDCISYQLWTLFERNNAYLDLKRGFDSTASPLPNSMYECGSGHSPKDASADALVFDVMP